MTDAGKNIVRLKNPVIIYGLLVFLMILCKTSLNNWWLTDQYIIYNLLSLFMLAFITNISAPKRKAFFKFIPLLILFYFFFNPVILKNIFLLSHILIIFLFFLLVKSKRLLLKPGMAVIPIEVIIIIYFL